MRSMFHACPVSLLMLFVSGLQTAKLNGGLSVQLKVEIISIAVVVPTTIVVIVGVVVVAVFVRKRLRTSLGDAWFFSDAFCRYCTTCNNRILTLADLTQCIRRHEVMCSVALPLGLIAIPVKDDIVAVSLKTEPIIKVENTSNAKMADRKRKIYQRTYVLFVWTGR